MRMVLNIVTFGNPAPPDYGGAIDVYYRIKALHALGVKINLFFFGQKGRNDIAALRQLCGSVRSYPRGGFRTYLDTRTPLSVATRSSADLLEDLNKTPGPILFEGFQSCALVTHEKLHDRQKYIRAHNIESIYYRLLAGTVRSFAERLICKWESARYQGFQQRVGKMATGIFAISDAETTFFASHFTNVTTIYPAHRHPTLTCLTGKGDYVLVQGDFTIRDNQLVAKRTAEICESLSIPCIVAGRSDQRFSRMRNFEVISNVSSERQLFLMQQAQIHVIDSAIIAGFKLKLVDALFTGRHVVVRDALVPAAVRDLVHAFSSAAELKILLNKLMNKEVSLADIEHRKSVLLPMLSNQGNAQKMMKVMFGS